MRNRQSVSIIGLRNRQTVSVLGLRNRESRIRNSAKLDDIPVTVTDCLDWLLLKPVMETECLFIRPFIETNSLFSSTLYSNILFRGEEGLNHFLKLCTLFSKVVSFIYKKFYLNERVPLMNDFPSIYLFCICGCNFSFKFGPYCS